MTSFLDDTRYRDYVRVTHPELSFTMDRLSVPTFRASLDTREPLLPGFLKRMAHVAHRVTPRHVTPQCLFLGTPFEPYDQTKLLDDIDDINGFVKQAYEVARRDGDSVVVMTNVARHHPAVAAFEAAGFLSFPSFPDCVIPLESDFDALLSERSRARRRNVRRHIGRFEKAGHTLERAQEPFHDGPALFSFYRPFFDRARVRWFPHTASYFEGLAHLDDRVVLTVARDRERRAIGFVVGFVDDDSNATTKNQVRTFHSGRVGVHPDFYRKDAVYFRLVYRAIEDAISVGAKSISLEPTAYRLKRHLGAESIPLVNLLLPVSPLWRLLARSAAPMGRRVLRHLDDDAILDEHY